MEYCKVCGGIILKDIFDKNINEEPVCDCRLTAKLDEFTLFWCRDFDVDDFST